MACTVTVEPRGGGPVYILRDESSGASASILPSYGFNMFDLRLPSAGKVRPVLAAAPDWPDRPREPARHGTPILFPFPNRIRGAAYSFEGREYHLPLGTAAPNAIHGFAHTAAWDVVAQTAGDEAAVLTGRFQISRQAPAALESWPADAILEIRYSLSGSRLTMGITVTNPGAGDLPYGFGIHPYFYLPFDPAGDRGATQVIVPASQYWVLDQSLPTGERRDVDARLDFRQGQPRAGLKLDDVLTGLQYEGDRCVCRLVDEGLKAEFQLSFDGPFREVVVFTPKNDEAICLEPYTQTTDAINLAAAGIDGGLRQLAPGANEHLTITMETRG